MAKLIFRLRNVPEDEAEEVRALLQQHEFDFYETSPGNWGISMPGIWLRDESRLEQARELLQDYQQQRAMRIRQEYQALKEAGQAPSMFDNFRQDPLRFVLYMAIIAAVAYISLTIFF
jgi:hypothetical protein